MKVRILWVRPGDKSMSPGDILSDAEVAERGHLLRDLIDRGEAEILDGGPAPAAPRSRKTAKG